MKWTSTIPSRNIAKFPIGSTRQVMITAMAITAAEVSCNPAKDETHLFLCRMIALQIPERLAAA